MRSLVLLLLLLSPFSLSHGDHDEEDHHRGKYRHAPFTEAEERAPSTAEDKDEIHFTITYTIKTSYCFEAETKSGFEVYGTLDFYGQLLWLGKLTRDSCRVHQKYDTRFEGQAVFVAPRVDIIECIQGGNSDACDPRGEVVFIDMREEFVDDWSIEMVTVNSFFEYDLQQYNTSFEHSILDPCYTRFDQPGIYQIGPASGQMIRLAEMPRVMDWISAHI